MSGSSRRRMPSLDPRPEVGRGTQRLVGLLVLGLGAVVIVETVRSLAGDELSTRQALWLTGLVLPVSLLAVLFGWRLVLNRPNAYGSIMGPMGWRLCAASILLAAGAVAALQLKLGLGISWGLLSPVALAGACAVKAEGLARRGAMTFGRAPWNEL